MDMIRTNCSVTFRCVHTFRAIFSRFISPHNGTKKAKAEARIAAFLEQGALNAIRLQGFHFQNSRSPES